MYTIEEMASKMSKKQRDERIDDLLNLEPQERLFSDLEGFPDEGGRLQVYRLGKDTKRNEFIEEYVGNLTPGIIKELWGGGTFMIYALDPDTGKWADKTSVTIAAPYRDLLMAAHKTVEPETKKMDTVDKMTEIAEILRAVKEFLPNNNSNSEAANVMMASQINMMKASQEMSQFTNTFMFEQMKKIQELGEESKGASMMDVISTGIKELGPMLVQFAGNMKTEETTPLQSEGADPLKQKPIPKPQAAKPSTKETFEMEQVKTFISILKKGQADNDPDYSYYLHTIDIYDGEKKLIDAIKKHDPKVIIAFLKEKGLPVTNEKWLEGLIMEIKKEGKEDDELPGNNGVTVENKNGNPGATERAGSTASSS